MRPITTSTLLAFTAASCWSQPGLKQSYRLEVTPAAPIYLEPVTVALVDDSGVPAAFADDVLRRAVVEPAGVLEADSPGHFRAVGAGSAVITVSSGVVKLTQSILIGCGGDTPDGTVVPHGGDISSDEAWQAQDGVHRVTSDIRVRAGATLTLGACATIELAHGVALRVGDGEPGRLVARGTREHPLILRGVSLPDGSRDAWAGVQLFLPNAQGSLLRFMQIDDAAGVASTSEPAHAAVDVVGDGTTLYKEPPLTLQGIDIRACAELGLRFRGLMVSTDFDWTDNSVTGCGSFPVSVDAQSLGATPHGSFSDNGSAAAPRDLVQVTGGFTGPNYQVWQDPGVPYRVEANLVVGADPAAALTPATSDQRLGGIFVVAEAGTTLQFAPGTGLFVGSDIASYTSLLPKARFITHGTFAHPVLLTSAMTPPAAGDWLGVIMMPNTKLDVAMGSDPTVRNDSRYSLTSLTGAIVEYAGGASGLLDDQGNERRAGIVVNGYTSAGITSWLWLLEGSTVRHNLGYGLSSPYGPLDIQTVLSLGSGDTFMPSCLCDNELGPLSPPSDPPSSATAAALESCPCPGLHYWVF